ncbi:hypothetical protein SAMN04489716_1630 [Actinoplanes derwentensis]|uniref:Uncharacterized protein n=1 Tax=Actinoplanes derwentensis TaxID=113562 RepID=A0A1H1V3Q4_9ACTN|nr:hypothetical protein SAMN04489716_1630 [Actinoplanes derwentensis]
MRTPFAEKRDLSNDPWGHLGLFITFGFTPDQYRSMTFAEIDCALEAYSKKNRM